MSPEDAREMLEWIAKSDDRRMAYVAAGGRRRVWKCDCPCGCYTEASEQWQAARQLRRFASCGRVACVSTNPIDTGKIAPPVDWEPGNAID